MTYNRKLIYNKSLTKFHKNIFLGILSNLIEVVCNKHLDWLLVPVIRDGLTGKMGLKNVMIGFETYF
jgi:hypothetical protein